LWSRFVVRVVGGGPPGGRPGRRHVGYLPRMRTDWMLDETAYAGPDHLHPEAVARYDRKQGDEPDRAAHADIEVLRAAGIDATSTVVDLGAGTGRFAFAVARHVGRVIAVDVSPAMVAHLERRVEEEGLGNIEVVRRGLLSYEHTGPPADAVYLRNVLHQLPDLFKVVALRRIARMLRPGGVLRLRDLVLDCSPDELDEVVARWLEAAPDDPADGYTAEDLAEHLRDEYSTFSWLLRPMLEATGFTIVDDTSTTAFGAYTCTRDEPSEDALVR
jgi:FkbM family methyltransferase